jgi:NDP-sugar pyrophosphorylase family protein
LGVKVIYNDHRGASETGDAFRSALENHNLNLPETFLALNGDQITDLSIKDMWTEHQRYNPIATMAICPVRIPYGIPSITDDNVIEVFREKPILHDTFMNTGIYIFNKSILPHLPQKGSIEKETFAKLAQLGKLRAYKHQGFFTTINDHRDLAAAQELLQNTKAKLL